MSIQVENLSKTYTDQKAVDSISFSINKGEIVGFLGPNGAGKSTVMKILTGYISAFEGEVLIDGKSIIDEPLMTKRSIGYLPEHNPLYLEMYVKEYLSFHTQLYKVSKSTIDEIISEVGLLQHSSKKIKELSKGYRQRVGLAAALLHNPDVLILDEPTTGLDPNQIVEIRDLIKKAGKNKTVLFSTHILQEVEAVCDRVIIIDKGKIIADRKIQDIHKTKEQVIEVEFDVKIDKKLLSQIPNLIKIKNVSEMIWELILKNEKDQRSVVFDFAKQNDLKILNLTQKTKNLESLFRELTQTTQI